MVVKFFRSSAAFRAWLAKHHGTKTELWVGFYRKDSGKSGLTYPEAVDAALCFGWIDGVRKKLDETSYVNRFTPRRRGSNWSTVNIKRVGELTALGLMAPAGVSAFEARHASRRGPYSYESRPTHLPDALENVFRKNKRAWEFYQGQAPWYRRVTTHWVMSAVKEDTRARRLGALIRDSAKQQRMGLTTSTKDEGRS
jgi:uncharacterized protein YdeI (YjbR/CyaY-like superfamily)